jgi:predicted component of type VI protein secretion system
MNQLSNEDRVFFVDKADRLQDEETKSAITIMRGLFELPEGYKPVSDQDPNFKKAQVYNRLVGRLTSRIEKAKRLGQDIDAILEVDNLIAEIDDDFNEALNEVVKKSALNTLNTYSLDTEIDLTDLTLGLNYLKQLQTKITNEGKSAGPNFMKRSGLTKQQMLLKLDIHIKAVEKALAP